MWPLDFFEYIVKLATAAWFVSFTAGCLLIVFVMAGSLWLAHKILVPKE